MASAASVALVDALDAVQPDIEFGLPSPQSRLTVAFRGLLVLPHLVVLYVLVLLSLPLVVVGWFAALILGRLPGWIARYEMAVIAYAVRVNAYLFMLARRFPPFSLAISPSDYSVRVELGASRLSRLKVFFRWLLIIPSAFVAYFATNGLVLFSPIIWLVTLVLGRTPQLFFSASAAVIRYQARYYAYLSLVTDAYPRGLFDAQWVPAPEGGSRELRRLSDGARRLVWLIVLLGVAGWIGSIVLRYELAQPPARNPAVISAEVKLEAAELNDSGRCDLRCLGEAYERFASTISHLPFPVSQLANVSVVVHDARQTGRLLIAASKSEDGAQVAGIDPADPPDSPLLEAVNREIAIVLGPGPLGIISK